MYFKEILIRECLRKRIEELRSLYQDNKPTYLGKNDPIINKYDIEINDFKNENYSGYYLPSTYILKNKPTIVLDHRQSIERLNFSFYHEVTHHLLATDEELISLLDDCLPTNLDNEKQIIERLADYGASEFLIPDTFISTILQNEEYSIKLIPILDELTNASKIACAFALVENAKHDAVIMIFRNGLNPYNYPKQDTLIPSVKEKTIYSEYSFSSPTSKYRFSRGINVPTDHIVSESFDSKQYIRSRDFIPRRNGNRDWIVDCEALYYKGLVFINFNLSDVTSEKSIQPSLFNE